MTPDEMLRLECLKLALSGCWRAADDQVDPVGGYCRTPTAEHMLDAARKFEAFITGRAVEPEPSAEFVRGCDAILTALKAALGK